MSCVVGIKTGDGRIIMGADSIYVGGGWFKDHSASPKLFRVGEFLIGSTGSIRVRQLVAHCFDPPESLNEYPDPEKYMVREFIPALRVCLKEGGAVKVEHGLEESGTFLVGVRGHLFVIGENYQCVEMGSEYAAIGCAMEWATGALYATSWDVATGGYLDRADAERARSPHDRLMIALECAANHNLGVRPPFIIEELGDAEEEAHAE